ncbi:intersectin-EH binding protein Ibp1 [Mycolicibacterium thermoresistibile]
MATIPFPTRRLLVAGGFAVAVVAAPAFVELAADSERQRLIPLAVCPAGEEPDHFTGVCVPHTVPNSPATAPFQSIPGNPNVPAVSLPGGGGAIPCTGRNVGQCIALSEVASPGPQAAPESHVGSSPTVHGHVGP